MPDEINKKSYYLGDKDFTKKENTDFKSSKRPIVGPGRFVLYQNYDLYDTPESDRGIGPGVGMHGGRDQYKSVQEFLEKRRKRNKNKYVREPQEYYADDQFSKSDKDQKKKRKKQIETKASTKLKLFKISMGLPESLTYGDSVLSYPVDDVFQDYSMNPQGTQIGGMFDYLAPRLNVDSVASTPIGWVRENQDSYNSDENFAKHKAKKHKKKISKIHGLLDRMVGRSYSGYPYGYGAGYGLGHGGYTDNRNYSTNTTNNYDTPDPGSDAGDVGGDAGDSGGGDGGGGE